MQTYREREICDSTVALESHRLEKKRKHFRRTINFSCIFNSGKIFRLLFCRINTLQQKMINCLSPERINFNICLPFYASKIVFSTKLMRVEIGVHVVYNVSLETKGQLSWLDQKRNQIIYFE